MPLEYTPGDHKDSQIQCDDTGWDALHAFQWDKTQILQQFLFIICLTLHESMSWSICSAY